MPFSMIVTASQDAFSKSPLPNFRRAEAVPRIGPFKYSARDVFNT